MFLVTGAAGKTGRAVIGSLSARSAPVRALVRRESYAERARAAGADEIVSGDLRDRSALDEAVEGVQAVYHIPPNMHPDEVGIGEAILAAAMEADVGRFVYHSVLHPQVEAMPHHWRKLQVEAIVLETGLPFTILQPAAYMQNTLGELRRAVEEGVYEAPYPLETRLAMVDLADVADVATAALTEAGHEGAIYELVGEPAISVQQVADTVAQHVGKPIVAREVPLSEWAEGARDRGIEAGRIEDFLAMFRHYARHHFVGNANVLTALLGRVPIRYAEFLSRELGTAAAKTRNEA